MEQRRVERESSLGDAEEHVGRLLDAQIGVQGGGVGVEFRRKPCQKFGKDDAVIDLAFHENAFGSRLPPAWPAG